MTITKLQYSQPQVKVVELESTNLLLEGSQEFEKETTPIENMDDVI